MSKNAEMLSLAAARKMLLAQSSRQLGTELISLGKLSSRVLAEDIVSAVNVPPADNSAMDGYALCHADTENTLSFRVTGKSLAGKPFKDSISVGECVRITTGACLPQGADSVEIQENVRLEESGDDTLIHLMQKPARSGMNVRYRGEDIAEGSSVLKAGCRLGAIELGVLATLGFAEAKVRKRLRVALLVSGDELRAPGEVLAPGEIYESNRYVLSAMLQKLGVELVDLGVVKDKLEDLRSAYLEGDRRADVIITCGGASVGETDYARQVLEELGTLNFWKVAIKPGKPFIYGQLKKALFFGLPGNPVSALVTFHQLVVPAIRKLQGEQDTEALSLEASLCEGIRPNRHRLEFVRGSYRAKKPGSGLEVLADAQQSSGAFCSLARSNCFILVPPGEKYLEAGTILSVLPFDELLGAC